LAVETGPAEHGGHEGQDRPFWQSPPDALIRELGSSPTGLSSAEAATRLQRDGPNTIEERRRRNLALDILRRLSNPLMIILMIAAAIAGATGDPASFSIIVIMILLSTTLDVVQEHRAEATAEALKHSIALRSSVLRDGTLAALPVHDLVAGDVVRLSAGDLVPADGVVIEANHLQVNEALLTGEAFPVEKTVEPAAAATQPAEASNALFDGTSILGGTATMLIVATGMRTRFGAIAASLASAQPPTAFERDIRRFGLLILRLTGFLVLFVLLANLALGRPPLEAFLFATALAVGLTPELLPMIMTVSLAHGARRMAHAKVIVKRLSAIHDLGQMDILCTDKTGTLTEARISLVAHPGPDGEDDERVAELAAVNAHFETGLRSPLDEALVAHAGSLNLDDWKKLDERPFDFERRRVSVLVEKAGRRIEIVKGAPETILALATHVEKRSGEPALLDDAERTRLEALHDERAAQGLRLLAVAWKDATGRTRIERDDDADLVFAGFCVFVDPPKPSATAAIARLEQAGVRIKVISGDAAPVIEHLVRELHLKVRGTLSGEEIAQLSDAALAARAGRVDLFARVTPDQKTRIVRALMARGHTVGFLGDGINDAPVIRAADIGLSVEGATDVAREAADMILLAPDLGVLADGVEEGRRTYANIMKYIRMGTSSNFGNMVSMAVASLFLPFLPLTAVQVLINNSIYDFSQVGIPLDDADREDLARPRGWDMHALLRFTAVMGLWSSMFDIATFVILLEAFKVTVVSFRSGWFVESMATQILVVFVIRTHRAAWRSRPHRALVLSSLVGLAAALLVALLPQGAALGFGTLTLTELATLAALVVAYLLGAEALKRIAMREASTGAHSHRRRPRGFL